MFVVGKSFTAEGIIRRTGEVVKASGWRHVKRLLEQRYLSVFDGEPVKCAKCGRMFTNDELLQDHIRIDHPEPETAQEEPETTQEESEQAQQETQPQKATESKPAEQKTEKKDTKPTKTDEKPVASKEDKPKTTKSKAASKETKKGGK